MYSHKARANLLLKAVKKQPNILKRLDRFVDDEDWLRVILSFGTSGLQKEIIFGTLLNNGTKVQTVSSISGFNFTALKTALPISLNDFFYIEYQLSNVSSASGNQILVGLSTNPNSETVINNATFVGSNTFTQNLNQSTISGTGAVPNSITYNITNGVIGIGRDQIGNYMMFGAQRIDYTSPILTSQQLYFCIGLYNYSTTLAASFRITILN